MHLANSPFPGRLRVPYSSDSLPILNRINRFIPLTKPPGKNSTRYRTRTVDVREPCLIGTYRSAVTYAGSNVPIVNC